jgi:ParB-like chromosome segregation protein Spo0J
VLPLAAIAPSLRNPRSDLAAELDALASGLRTQTEPDIAQPPLVERLGPDAYRVVFGARRVLAAARAGWTTIACLVCEQLDPLQAHTLRLVENLHRVAPHPLDEALAIKLAWLAANAEALGLREQAAAILAVEQPPLTTLAQLSVALATAGFTPTRPAISQPVLLAQLGLDLDAERLKKLLAILKLDGEAQERARETELTEAGLRAIARLPVADQRGLIAAIADDPWLARRARRIARRVAQQGVPLEQALAEARGVVYQGPDAPAADTGDDDDTGTPLADADVSAPAHSALASDSPKGTEDRQARRTTRMLGQGASARVQIKTV